MQVQKIESSRLNPATYNPRKVLKPGDKEFEKLKRSIEVFGFVEPIVWNSKTGNVVGGHQRLSVLLELGYKKIECVVVELDLQKEKALNLALNRIQGDWDETKLASLMADLDAAAFDVSLSGFDAPEIDALMNRFYSHEAIEDNFESETARREIAASGAAITQPGQLWQIGPHRLLCGDNTLPESYNRLMADRQAQAAVTSPPAQTLEDYKKNGLAPWLDDLAAVIRETSLRAPVVCWHLGDMLDTGSQYIEPVSFFTVKLFSDLNYRPLWFRVWKKQGLPPLKRGQHLTTNKPIPEFDYLGAFTDQKTEAYNEQDFELVSAYASHGAQFVKRLTREERRKWGYAGIWEIPISRGADSSFVPIELPWRCIRLHSDPASIILDPFASLGTTLIAAEQSGRVCYCIERNPLNCDLIVKRWEQFTGKQATLL